jgi:hypothetical protein
MPASAGAAHWAPTAGEYTGKDFANFLHQQGIRHVPTEPYTLELNGIAERLNRTLLDMVRTMLIQAGLPRTYWAEALHHATFVYNHVPHKTLQGKTPAELWTGEYNPVLGQVRTFGCKAHVQVTPNLCGKLGSRSQPASVPKGTIVLTVYTLGPHTR